MAESNLFDLFIFNYLFYKKSAIWSPILVSENTWKANQLQTSWISSNVHQAGLQPSADLSLTHWHKESSDSIIWPIWVSLNTAKVWIFRSKVKLLRNESVFSEHCDVTVKVTIDLSVRAKCHFILSY